MLRNPLFLVLCGAMLLGGGYWLWQRGETNILAYGMLLLCPLMHLFMHRGHGHHHGREGEASHQKDRPSCH